MKLTRGGSRLKHLHAFDTTHIRFDAAKDNYAMATTENSGSVLESGYRNWRRILCSWTYSDSFIENTCDLNSASINVRNQPFLYKCIVYGYSTIRTVQQLFNCSICINSHLLKHSLQIMRGITSAGPRLQARRSGNLNLRRSGQMTLAVASKWREQAYVRGGEDLASTAPATRRRGLCC